MSIGLIINDRSNRSADVMNALREVAGEWPLVTTEVLSGVDGLDAALTRMAQNRVDTLIIAGGDGTFQAVFTDIINNARFETLPRFVALPCGMTNVIANDCGLHGVPGQSLHRFLKRHERGELSVKTRHLMGLRRGAEPPVYGFFFGAAAFYSAVRFSREKIQSLGAKRSLALSASIASFLLRITFARAASLDSIELELPAADTPQSSRRARQLLFMATTLHSLGTGLYPFWGKENAPMAITTLRHPGKRLLRAAPAVVRAKPKPWFDEYGYHSWNSHALTAAFDGPYVFDGEIFEAQASAPLTVDTAHSVNFLT